MVNRSRDRTELPETRYPEGQISEAGDVPGADYEEGEVFRLLRRLPIVTRQGGLKEVRSLPVFRTSPLISADR